PGAPIFRRRTAPRGHGAVHGRRAAGRPGRRLLGRPQAPPAPVLRARPLRPRAGRASHAREHARDARQAVRGDGPRLRRARAHRGHEVRLQARHDPHPDGPGPRLRGHARQRLPGRERLRLARHRPLRRADHAAQGPQRHRRRHPGDRRGAPRRQPGRGPAGGLDQPAHPLQPGGPPMRSKARYLFSRSRLSVVGLAIALAVVLAAVLAPYITPYPEHAGRFVDFANASRPPGARYLLGTDTIGRDVLTRIVFGFRVSLLLGVIVLLLAVPVGVLLGLLAGYFGGRVETVIMRVTDVFLAIPPLVLALAVMGFLEPNLQNAIMAVT